MSLGGGLGDLCFLFFEIEFFSLAMAVLDLTHWPQTQRSTLKILRSHPTFFFLFCFHTWFKM